MLQFVQENRQYLAIRYFKKKVAKKMEFTSKLTNLNKKLIRKDMTHQFMREPMLESAS